MNPLPCDVCTGLEKTVPKYPKKGCREGVQMKRDVMIAIVISVIVVLVVILAFVFAFTMIMNALDPIQEGNVELVSGYSIDPVSSENVTLHGFEPSEREDFTGVASEIKDDWLEVEYYGSILGIQAVYSEQSSEMQVEIYSNDTLVHQETIDVPGYDRTASHIWSTDSLPKGNYTAIIRNNEDTLLFITTLWVDASFLIIN